VKVKDDIPAAQYPDFNTSTLRKQVEWTLKYFGSDPLRCLHALLDTSLQNFDTSLEFVGLDTLDARLEFCENIRGLFSCFEHDYIKTCPQTPHLPEWVISASSNVQ
jgi:hypothetical protein